MDSEVTEYRECGCQWSDKLPDDLFPLLGNSGLTEQANHIPRIASGSVGEKEDQKKEKSKQDSYAIREIKLCATLRGRLGINSLGLHFVNHLGGRQGVTQQ